MNASNQSEKTRPAKLTINKTWIAIGGLVGLVTIVGVFIAGIQLWQSARDSEAQNLAHATLVTVLEAQYQVQSEMATLQSSDVGVGPTATAVAQKLVQLEGTVEALEQARSEAEATLTPVEQVARVAQSATPSVTFTPTPQRPAATSVVRSDDGRFQAVLESDHIVLMGNTAGLGPITHIQVNNGTLTAVVCGDDGWCSIWPPLPVGDVTWTVKFFNAETSIYSADIQYSQEGLILLSTTMLTPPQVILPPVHCSADEETTGGTPQCAGCYIRLSSIGEEQRQFYVGMCLVIEEETFVWPSAELQVWSYATDPATFKLAWEGSMNGASFREGDVAEEGEYQLEGTSPEGYHLALIVKARRTALGQWQLEVLESEVGW